MSKRGGNPRNVLTYLDDQGLYRDLVRDEAETTTQFRARVLSSMSRNPGPTLNGMTHAIDVRLFLGQDYLFTVSTDNDYYLSINNTELILSGTNYYSFSLLNIDAGGYWFEKPLYNLQNEINQVSGLQCTLETAASGLPSILLEQQSSYYQITEERVPTAKRFRLGASDGFNWTGKKLIIDQVKFNDLNFFRYQVSGIPQKEGEWSATEDGWINLYSNPEDLYFVDYQYNVFISGQSMKLVGNGAKVINLAADDAQKYLFVSGSQGEARTVSHELLNQDRMFWGK